MVYPARKLRIIGASLVALLMVAGAYAASGPISFFGINVVGAQTSAELLREYAAKDSDSDSLPDWQEALYNTDPYNAESFRAGMSDGDAVAQGLVQPKVAVAEAPDATDLSTVPGTAAAPSSLTDRFAQELFKQYMTSRGEVAPTTEEIATFVEDGMRNLAQSSGYPEAYGASDVHSSGTTGPTAMKTYAIEVENAFARNTVVENDSALMYFSEAINGDKTAHKNLEQVGKAYKNIAIALMKISVPREAAAGHLAIANAFVHLSEISADMGAINEDPLRALMGIGLYDPYATALTLGFAQLNGVFEAERVPFVEGQPGYEFYAGTVLAKQVSTQ